MGMVAILIKWPGLFDQTFFPSSYGSSIWNFTTIGPVVSGEKLFKECGRHTTYEGGLPILDAHQSGELNLRRAQLFWNVIVS